VLVVAVLVVRRLRQTMRARREREFRARLEEIFAELDPRTGRRDPRWLREQIESFDELERPIAAVALIERMKPASEEEREHALAALREVGVVDLLLRASRGRMPWRRAGAVRTLGWIGAEEGVPLLIARLSDRNRHVRESAVRALGRIGDRRALQPLGELLRSPGLVGEGVVYDALIAFGHDAEPVFAGALRSPTESVRVASSFAIAAISDPATARPLLEPLLQDGAAVVRAAAAESLALVGGESMPEALARATRDELAAVRNAATAALGSHHDVRAVELALSALHDPDRDTAVHAGEALVRLSRQPVAGPSARTALREARTAWPVEWALPLSSIRGDHA